MSEAWRLAGTAAPEEGTAAGGSLGVGVSFSLNDSSCHFLNEKRYAVGAFDYVLPNTLRQ
jgi:hypothetical protein